MTAPVAYLDTETTGLDLDRHEIWEVGLILPEGEHHWFLPVDLARADPFALDIGRYHLRDQYARNCPDCNGSRERFARERPTRLKHPDDARLIETTIHEHTLIVYDAHCPNELCEWKRKDYRAGLEKLRKEITEHVARCERVAAEWSRPFDAF